MRCALTALILTLPALAAPERSFADLLPADTFAFLEVAPMTAEEQERAAAFKAMREPDLKSALDRMLEAQGNFSKVAMPMGASTVRAALDMRASGVAFEVTLDHGKRRRAMSVRGHLAVALVGVERRGNWASLPDAVAAIGVEGDPEEARQLVRALLVGLAREMGSEGVREWEHGGARCTSVRLDGIALHVGAVGPRVVVATRRARLADVIDRASRGAEGSLSSSPMHREILRTALGDGTVTALLSVNARAVFDWMRASGDPDLMGALQWVQVTGLGGLQGLCSVTRVSGDGVAGSTSVLLRGRRTGLARLFEKGAPAGFGCLDFAPRDTLYVAAGRFDLAGIYRALAEAAQPMAVGLGMAIQRETGVNVLADVVPRVGPEGALIVSLNDGLIPDVGVAFESDQPEKLRGTVLTLLDSVAWERGTGVEPTRIGGVPAHVIKLHPRLSDLPVAPTFGVVDGKFLFTLFPISFQRFAATKRGERPSVKENPDFAALRKRVPDEALSLSYLDVRRGVTIAYDTVMPLLQAMPRGEGGVPMYEFPEASIFTKHLYGRIAWRTADDRGMHWHSHSSTDIGALLSGLGAAGASLLYLGVREEPAAGAESRPQQVAMPVRAERAEVHRCRTNVRHIKSHLVRLRYAKKPFPDSLDGLRGRWIDEELLVVPGSGGKAYTWHGPGGKHGILLHGEPNGPDGKVCVLTTDLKMMRVSPETLRSRLEGK